MKTVVNNIVRMQQTQDPHEQRVHHFFRDPRLVSTGTEWIVSELAANKRCKKIGYIARYTSPPYSPSIAQVERLPFVLDKGRGPNLSLPQRAIILANTFSPTRAVAINDFFSANKEDVLINKMDVLVGVRPVIRVITAPLDTALIGIMSALMCAREHYDHYSKSDLWRADDAGCVSGSDAYILPSVFCVVSPRLCAEWRGIAQKCAGAFPEGEVRICENGKFVVSEGEYARSRGLVSLHVSSSYDASYLMSINTTSLPMVLVMDEFSTETCYLRHVKVPFTMLVVSGVKCIERATSADKRNDGLVRTIFRSHALEIFPYDRIAACDVGTLYYRHLILSHQFAQTVISFSASPAFVRRHKAVTILDNIPSSIHTDALRLWLATPSTQDTVPLLLLLDEEKKENLSPPSHQMLTDHFGDYGDVTCMVCTKSLDCCDDANEMIEGDSALITGCCCRLLCVQCCTRLVKKTCPQCALPILSHSQAIRLDLSHEKSEIFDWSPNNLPELCDLLGRAQRSMPSNYHFLNNMLDAMHSAGLRRVILSWEAADVDEIARPSKRTLYIVDGFNTKQSKRRKTRTIVTDTVREYEISTDGSTTSVLVVNPVASAYFSTMCVAADAIISINRSLECSKIVTRTIRACRDAAISTGSSVTAASDLLVVYMQLP